jgi:S-adenosylmethionine uptake transporter
MQDNRKGIMYMTSSGFFNSLMVMMVASLGKLGLVVPAIVFLRSVFGMLILLPQEKFVIFPKQNQRLHFFRLFLVLGGNLSIYYAITKLPKSFITIITFIVPLLTIYLMQVIYKQKPSSRNILASFVAFIGILIALFDKSILHNNNYLAIACVFACAIMFSFNNVVLKKLVETETARSISLQNSVWQFIVLLPIVMLNPPHLTGEMLAYGFFVALFSNLFLQHLTDSMKYAEYSVVAPFDFTRLIFTAIFAYLFFAETVTVRMIIGGVVVFAGVFIGLSAKSR